MPSEARRRHGRRFRGSEGEERESPTHEYRSWFDALPGFNFHPLVGKPKRYSIHVNGPWTITFGWEAGEAVDVDLEQYH